MKNQDWKLKYQDLKLKFLDAVDVSFRLGFEQGAQNAQVQQAQQAEAVAQQAAMQPGQPGEQSGDSGQFGKEPSDGSELDQHIGQLESMLGSQKPGSNEGAALQKSINSIKEVQRKMRQDYEFHKSEKAIAAIGKAMNSKFSLGKTATKNMSEPAKKALNMQEQIVADMMKSFEEEEKRAAESITKTLNFEQLLKG